jgi:hypothetical protein
VEVEVDVAPVGDEDALAGVLDPLRFAFAEFLEKGGYMLHILLAGRASLDLRQT